MSTKSKSYLAFYEEQYYHNLGVLKLRGELPQPSSTELSRLALKTGLVSIEESKKIVNTYQVDALDTKKVKWLH